MFDGGEVLTAHFGAPGFGALFSGERITLGCPRNKGPFLFTNFGLMTPVQFLNRIVETCSKYRSTRAHASQSYITQRCYWHIAIVTETGTYMYNYSEIYSN